jgi:hypothetical protein
MGLFTRMATIPLIIDMLVAISTTKVPLLLKSGFWAMAHEARRLLHAAWLDLLAHRRSRAPGLLMHASLPGWQAAMREPNEEAAAIPGSSPALGSLREPAVLFLRLGVTAFGGPAVHIALMEEKRSAVVGGFLGTPFLTCWGPRTLFRDQTPPRWQSAIRIGSKGGEVSLWQAALLFCPRC